MIGTKVKQINNLVITQKDRGYYVWTPDGSLLYQSTVLRDVEQKCSACKSYLQKQNSSKNSFEYIKKMLYKQAQQVFSNYNFLPVEDSDFFTIWVEHPKSGLSWGIGFKYEHVKLILDGRVVCLDEVHNNLLTKNFSISFSNMEDSNYMKEWWSKLKKIVDTAIQNKVMYYGKTILTNVRPLLNDFYITAPVHGIGTFNDIKEDVELFKRKYNIKYGYSMYTYLTETTSIEIIVDFFEKDNEIKCGIYFPESNLGQKKEPGYYLIVTVNTRNIAGFTQSLAKKLNKIAYEETLCYRESIKEYIESGHPLYKDVVQRIKKEKEMRNKVG